ncbi:hypothetical protein ACLOJK_027046 [Asimina triloba]
MAMTVHPSQVATAARRGSVFADGDERRTTAWRGGDASGQCWADDSDGVGGQAASTGTNSMAIDRRWLQWRHGSSDASGKVNSGAGVQRVGGRSTATI